MYYYCCLPKMPMVARRINGGGTVNWLIVFLLLMLLLFVHFSDAGNKNKREKQQKGKRVQNVVEDKKHTEEAEEGAMKQKMVLDYGEPSNKDIIMDSKNRRCPPKGSAKWGSSMPIDDALGADMMANFVDFFRNAKGDIESRVGITLRVNCILWFLRRSIGEMMETADQLLHKSNLSSLEPCIDRDNWHKIVHLVPDERTKFTICVMYKFGLSLHQFMHSFGIGGSEWADLLRKLSMASILNANVRVVLDCDSEEQMEQIFKFLFALPTIKTIVAYNISELLKMSEPFRHFVCHEIDVVELKIELNSKMLNASGVVLLEDEFPDVFRIETSLNTTIIERCRILLMNRTNSAVQRRAYSNWAMGWLIGQLRDVTEHILSMEQSTLSAQAIVALRNTVDEQCSKALDDMMSEEQLCLLDRLNEFINNLSAKAVRSFEKQIKKVAKGEECADERRRAKALDEFRRTTFSRTIIGSINGSIWKSANSEIFLQILLYPGAKTRMVKLLRGGKEKLAELKDDLGLLMTRFYENDVFVSDHRLFGHYELVLTDDSDGWYSVSRRMGANVVVFMRWAKRELAQRGLDSVYDQMRTYVDEHIYDPMFDETDVHRCNAMDQFLEKMFFYTKNLVELAKTGGRSNEEDDDGGKERREKFWTRWTKFVADGGQKMMELPAELLQENWKWMAQLHLREFGALLEGHEGEHLASFNKVLSSMDGPVILERLLYFFDQSAISSIFQRFGLNQQILGLSLRQRSFVCFNVSLDEEESEGESGAEMGTEKGDENNNNNNADDDKMSSANENSPVEHGEEADVKTGTETVDENHNSELNLSNQNLPIEHGERGDNEQCKTAGGGAGPTTGDGGEEDRDWGESDESAEQYFARNTAKIQKTTMTDETSEQLIMCPPKSAPLEMLQRIDKANNGPFVHFLFAQLMDFLNGDFVEFLFFKNAKRLLVVQFYAILWYLFELATKLIKLAVQLNPLADEQQKDRERAIAEEVAKLSVSLAQLTAIVPNGAEAKTDHNVAELKLIRLYKFIDHIVYNEKLMQNGVGWHEKIWHETDFGTIQSKQITWNVNSSSSSDCANCDQWETVELSEDEMLTIYMHFADTQETIWEFTLYFVYDLISRFTVSHRFFCTLSDIQKLANAKARLQMAMGEQHFSLLEKLLPEIMQFDMPLSITTVVSFKSLLAHKVGTDYSQQAEALLVLPLLLDKAKQKLAQLFTTQFAQLIPASYGEMLHSVRTELYKFLLQNTDDQLLLHHLCAVYLFCNFLDKVESFHQSIYKKHGIFGAHGIPAQQFRLDKCARTEVQQQTFQQQRAKLLFTHFEFLGYTFKMDSFSFADFMKEHRGSRSRLKELFSGNPSLYAILMQKYRSKIVNAEVFNGENLMNLYSHALFGQDIGTLVVGKLSVFIAVLVRWMDAELLSDHPNITLGLRQVGNTVWKQKTRPFFEDMFDELMDDDFDELERKSYILRELLKSLLRFVDQKRDERNLDKLDLRKASLFARRGKKKSNLMVKKADTNALVTIKGNNLAREWEQMVADALDRASEASRGKGMGEEETEQEEQQLISWIHHSQWETVVELLEHEQNRELLKKGLALHVGSEERLTFFLSAEMANEILALLNLEDKNGIIEAKLKGMKVRYRKDKKERGEREEREEKEQKELADRNMDEMIREEEKRMGELKTRMEKLQREKEKRKTEQRERERERREKEDRGATTGENRVELRRERMMKEEGQKEKNKRMKGEKERSEERMDKKRKEKGRAKKESAEERQTATEEREEKGMKREEKEIETEEEENLRNELAQVELDNFRSDSLLESKYFDFLKNPSRQKKRLLDIGALFNEIHHRIEAISKMNEVDEAQRQNIAKESANLRDLLENYWKNKNGMGICLKQELCAILKRIVTGTSESENGTNCANGDRGTVGNDEPRSTVVEESGGNGKRKQITLVLMQLHKNKIAKAVIEGNEEKNKNHLDILQTMDEQTKGGILSLLFGENETKANSMRRFKEHIDNWKTLLAQQNLDKELYGQFSRFMGQPVAEEAATLRNVVGMHEHMQQIYFQDTEYKMQDKMLKQILDTNGYGREEMPTGLMDEIKATISKWSNGDARLIVTGSHLLGTQTPGSDVDLICVVPQKLLFSEERQRFFGNPMSTCDLNGQNLTSTERPECADDSLFCQFCKNSKMEEITKIWSSYVQMLQFKLAGIKVDLSFVLIPGMDYLPDEPLDADDVEWMMEVLANQQRVPRAMLRALSSYLTNQTIIEQMNNNKKREKFRTLSLALKFWAKNHYIYGGIYGFFNGISLAILATKIILLYPNASVLFLLERLLVIFTIWNWPMPVKLTEAENKKIGVFDAFSWQLSKEETVPIITPSSLSQNCTYNINRATLKIIQKAMRETLFQLKLFRNVSSLKNGLANVFNDLAFTKKYQHFAVICCISAQAHIKQFCQFVDRKIRVKLAQLDEMTDRIVEYAHVRSIREPADNWNKKCPPLVDLSDFSGKWSPFCQIWLVGLQLNDQIKQLDKEKKEKINEQLGNELGTKIFKEYESEELKGWFQNVRLKSAYVPVEELAQWEIDK